MTDEEKAEEYADKILSLKPKEIGYRKRDILILAYIAGLKAGREETKAEWHDCFLSCSSPYCAAHFPAVEMQGELGNMSKRESEAEK